MALDLPLNPSREDRLIVAACRRDTPGADEIDTLASPFTAVAEAHRLIDRTYAHRVPGRVLETLDRAGWIDRLDAEPAAVFRAHLSRLRRRAALFGLELRRLARELDGAGLEPVLLKGAGLATSVYDSPDERFYADLDLLFDAPRTERALEVLLASGYTNPWPTEAVRGYRTFHYHLPLARPDGMILELHWDLVKPGRPYRLDPRGVIERAVASPGLPAPLRIPCLEDQLLHVVVQQLQDGFAQLSRTVDLDRLSATGRVDWDALVERALECRLGPATAVALQVARRLLATDCPGEVVEALAPGSLARAHLSLLDPVGSSLNQRFVGHPTTYNLLKLWLTQADSSRLAILAGLAHDMADHEPLKTPWDLERAGKPSGVGVVEFGKLALRQGVIYLKTLAGLPNERFRAQLRFWAT